MKTLAPPTNASDSFVTRPNFFWSRKKSFLNLSLSTVAFLGAIFIGFLVWETDSRPSAPAPIPPQKTVSRV